MHSKKVKYHSKFLIFSWCSFLHYLEIGIFQAIGSIAKRSVNNGFTLFMNIHEIIVTWPRNVTWTCHMKLSNAHVSRKRAQRKFVLCYFRPKKNFSFIELVQTALEIMFKISKRTNWNFSFGCENQFWLSDFPSVLKPVSISQFQIFPSGNKIKLSRLD